MLINLARLDWRRSNGDPSNSKLTDCVWNKLRADDEKLTLRLKAIELVAYYQPLKTLELVEGLIRAKKFVRQLPPVLKYVAYNFGQLTRSCEALWELAKHDDHPLNQHPSHPIRILAELCEVQPNKPFEYNDAVVDFGLKLLSRPDSWDYPNNPFDILTSIFKTEGHTISSENFLLNFGPYFINADFVTPLRRKVLEQIVKLLSDTDLKKAVAAAKALGHAFHYPMGQFGVTVQPETRDQWTPLFCEGLEAVEAALKRQAVDPLTYLVISKSISWHANFAPGKTAPIARRIKEQQPTSLVYRTIKTLIDGHGLDLRPINGEDHDKKWRAHIDELVQDPTSAYPDERDLRAFIGTQLAHICRHHKGGTSPFVLNQALIQSSEGYARAVVEDVIATPDSQTFQFAHLALEMLWLKNTEDGRTIVNRMISTQREDLRAVVAVAYDTFFYSKAYTDADIRLFETLIKDDAERVARCSIGSLRRLADMDTELQLKLALLANVGTSSELADDLLGLFAGYNHLERLSAEDVSQFLAKLMAIPELQGHWLQAFLGDASQRYPELTASFFMERVERAAATGDWDYLPCNHGPYGDVPMKFKESADYPDLLRKVSKWMKSRPKEDFLFSYRSRQLFETMFHPFDEEVLKLMDEWLVIADTEDLESIGHILNEADHDFVLDHQPFVERFPGKAAQFGSDAHKTAVSLLTVQRQAECAQAWLASLCRETWKRKGGARQFCRSYRASHPRSRSTSIF